jgi:alcohol dehydrogenase (cytochrome c)
MTMLKRVLCAAVIAGMPVIAGAQTIEDLKNDAATPDDVLTLGMGWDQTRYSPLEQINAKNVGRLVPVWNYSLGDNRGQEAQPIVHNGVMYVTTHDATHAIDVKTGKNLWVNKIEYPPETPRIVCCGIVNRGAAVLEGRLFRVTLDGNVIAISMETGEELWRSAAASIDDGYSMTLAPLVTPAAVITGVSGGEYGTRGFIDGWDPATGRHLWRKYVIPGPGEEGNETWPGDTWKHGGAPTWITGSYDPELNLVYWGTGNGGPWNAEFRKGDNLYITSTLAMRPETGEIVWHYQYSPNDPYDYDEVGENILTDMMIDGQNRKVMIHVGRNGFIYVLDRTNGELLRANQYVKHLNWADGIDMKTGRPIDSEITKKMRAGEEIVVWPGAFGGKNWFPASYSPKTGLVYSNTLEIGMGYKPVEPKLVKATFYVGIDLSKALFYVKEGEKHSYLRGIDPLTGKAKWEVGFDVANWSGTMATGGDLVFTGAQTGEFMAFDANTGDKLWQFQTGSGIIGQPVTYTIDGVQYITVASGIGGAYRNYFPLLGGVNAPEVVEKLTKVQPGGSFWTFALLK